MTEVARFPLFERRITKIRKVVETGIFYAELHELLTRVLPSWKVYYGGCEVKINRNKLEIIIKVNDTTELQKNDHLKINELTYMIIRRWGLKEDQIQIYIDKIQRQNLSAPVLLERLRQKIVDRQATRPAAYSIIKLAMGAGALGCEVVIAGKMRGARAQCLKYRDGYMVKSGDPSKNFVTCAIGHIPMKQAVVGIRVVIMHKSDPLGISGPREAQPDIVRLRDPKKSD